MSCAFALLANIGSNLRSVLLVSPTILLFIVYSLAKDFLVHLIVVVNLQQMLASLMDLEAHLSAGEEPSSIYMGGVLQVVPMAELVQLPLDGASMYLAVFMHASLYIERFQFSLICMWSGRKSCFGEYVLQGLPIAFFFVYLDSCQSS